jgi:hypothetical protein
MKNLINILLINLQLACLCQSVLSATYYVNDLSVVGDIYCMAAGNNGNNGLTASFPKATLANLLSTYAGSLTSGDIIRIDTGVYSDANISLNINGISLIGAGPSRTFFDNADASADANRLFTITSNNVTIEGIYVTGYNRGTGGASAIQISGVSGVVLTNVLTDENRSGGGSATVVIDGGSGVAFNGGGSNCNSTGSVAGGGVNVEGNGNNVTFNNYSFSNNSKDFEGGSGLHIVGNNTTNVTVNNSIFADNRNLSDGGAVFISGSNLTVNGSCFMNNSTFGGSGPKYGGAVTVGRGATVSFTNCSFINNSVSNSGNGGAIAINTSITGSGATAIVNLTTCTFTGNTSSSNGNHLYARVGSSNPAIFNINECTFSATPQAISNDNTATINLQNSGNPSRSGTINTINTTAPSTVASTNYPALQGSCYGVILPVEFTSFSAHCTNSHVQLQWATTTEHNNEYFSIEHASEDGQFELISSVNGQLNSTTKTNYYLTDYFSQPGINYYRLSQTDTDGRLNVLSTISMVNDCLKNNLQISCVYNAEENSLLIGYSIEKSALYEIKMLNSMGKVLFVKEEFFDRNNRMLRVELNEFFTSGVYFVQLSNGIDFLNNKVMVNK